METVYVKKNQAVQSREEINYQPISVDQNVVNVVTDIATAILLVVLVVLGCIFINPIVLFSGLGLLIVGYSVVRTATALNKLNYDLGNDLLEQVHIEEFKEAYERD